MSKEIFIKLYDRLGRDPTEEEISEELASQIDNAMNYRDDALFEEKPKLGELKDNA